MAQQSEVERIQAELDQHQAEDAARIELLVNLAEAYLFVDPTEAERLGRQALDAADNLSYAPGRARANLAIARAFQFRGFYADDVAYLNKAFEIAGEIEQTGLMAEIKRNLGTHYLYTGSFESALQHLIDALQLARESEDPTVTATTLFSLGTVYNEIGNFDDASRSFSEALVLFQEVGNRSGIAVVYASLGEVSENIGDYRAALEQLHEGAEIMKDVGDISGQAYAHASIGSVQKKMGDLDAAFESFSKSLEFGFEVNDQDILARAHTAAGDILTTRGDYDRAGGSLRAALKFAEAGGNKEEQMEAHRALATLYELTEEYKLSTYHLRQQMSLHDELHPANYTERLAQLQARYATKERELELNRLRRANAEAALEVERGRAQRNIAVGISAIVIVILMGLWNGYMLTARASRQAKEQNRRLTEIGHELERANRVKSDILANTSHEIRTPLNGILGLATLLQQSKLTSEQRSNVRSIEHSGRTLLHLLNDILDLSRIEAGKLEIEVSSVDLRDALKAQLPLWREQAEQKGLKLNIECDSDFPEMVIAAGSRVLQVLGNFVNNAIKFTKRGGILVRVRVEECRDEDITARFEVEDSGIGIPAEDRGFLFERFSQLDRSTTRSYGGTGLGLAICKELVDLMGGAIGVDSELGKGSTFWFTLQLPLARRSVGRVVKPVTVGGKSETRAARRLRVLIAEDNVINQKVIEGLVKGAGHAPTLVSNGEEVLEKLGDDEFDLVLMDIQMPQIDGVTAASMIRELPDGVARIPIVALTANAMAGDREKYLRQGFDDYIAKPIDPTILGTVLENFAIETEEDRAEALREMA